MSEENSGALSVDQAVAQLVEAPSVNREEENVDTGAENATEDELSLDEDSTQDETHDLETDDEDAGEGPSGDDVEEDGEEEAADEPSLDPHPFWDAEEKAHFAKLDRASQQFLLQHEERRSKAVDRQMQTLAHTRKVAEEQAQTMASYASRMEQLLEQATPLYASKWDGINWSQYFAMNPEQAAIDKAAHDFEASQIQAMRQAREAAVAEAEKTELAKFRAEQTEILKSKANTDPALKKIYDPNQGHQEQMELAQYLLDRGIPVDRFSYMSATETEIALKAKLYDDLLAKQSSKKSVGDQRVVKSQTTQKAPKLRAPVASSKPQSQSRIEQQTRRLAQTGKVDDGVALYLAMQNQKRK